MSQASKLLRRRPVEQKAAEPAKVSDEWEGYVGRFAYPVRREVRRLMRSSARLVDLAMVFPGAMYALASKRRPVGVRRAAISLVEEGAPLKNVARTLDLPLWLRRLPPEAFQQPIDDLPAGETFTRRVATRLPGAPSHSAFWLQSVAFGAKACNEDFSLWLADQAVYAEDGNPEQLFGMLAAYAWHSRATQTRAHTLIVVPWRPEIAFDTALCAAKSWLNRMRLVLQLGPGVLTDSWLAGGRCAASPSCRCSTAWRSWRKRAPCRTAPISMPSGSPTTAAACSRCGASASTSPRWRSARIRARPACWPSRSSRAATTWLHRLDVWQAAYAWLSSQSALRRLPPRIPPDRRLDDEAWGQLMAPYRRRTNGAPWLPQKATQAVFDTFNSEMADLARRGGVSSWLFT